MTKFKTGAAALGALQSGNDGGGNTSSIDFAKFSVGKTYKVRVLGTEDLMQYFGYGMYKKVNTFVAKNPSERDERGNAIANHTAWDLAEKYYRDKQFAASDAKNETDVDKFKKLASPFRGKERFVMGFVNLADGVEIVIDLTRDQALAVYATITKYEKKLGKLAFELSKTNTGTKASDTRVALTPIIDFEDDLTPDEQANFAKYEGKTFNHALFEGLLFEADEKTQIENLVAAGFDITLIGLSIGGQAQADDVTEIGEVTDLDDGDLPF
ncbi:hypothetical protein GJU41_11790 [Bacillus idriensis]|uniref:Uncharacterized protein n=1 Tax=Metabacillus idriensis TaxID=324768 RepID=A0A6I2MBC5_9BACI|nr:hypothetical protein [Metabacillus idriensis]MRX54654.1 hypothetical protein [Metabacillus idriensis]